MSDIAFYAVWGNTEGIQPGVYRTVWTGQLQNVIEGTQAKCKKVGNRKEGDDLIAAAGQGWVRNRLPKAEALGNHCWYCARIMNVNAYSQPDAAESEHQVPRCTPWEYVNREENIVVACRRCNNGKTPGKGDRDVQAFRERLQVHESVRRIVFYGEILRWVREYGPVMGLPLTGLNPQQAELVVSWYLRDGRTRLHRWTDDHADILRGLSLPIPPDAPPYALGAPWRLPVPPRAIGTQDAASEWDDIDF